MQKLDLTSNQPVLEDKINEIIDVVHDLHEIIEQQTKLIAKQLDHIRSQSESINRQEQTIKMQEVSVNLIRKQLPEILQQAVKEQNIDIFQNWLNK